MQYLPSPKAFIESEFVRVRVCVCVSGGGGVDSTSSFKARGVLKTSRWHFSLFREEIGEGM